MSDGPVRVTQPKNGERADDHDLAEGGGDVNKEREAAADHGRFH